MGDEQKPVRRSLDDIDLKILESYKKNPHMTQQEAARLAGVHYNTVCRRLKRNIDLTNAIDEMKESLEDILANAKIEAAHRMKNLVQSETETIALKASTELLRSELAPRETTTHAPIRFVTVVNEVGVLESQAGEVVDVEGS